MEARSPLPPCRELLQMADSALVLVHCRALREDLRRRLDEVPFPEHHGLRVYSVHLGHLPERIVAGKSTLSATCGFSLGVYPPSRRVDLLPACRVLNLSSTEPGGQSSQMAGVQDLGVTSSSGDRASSPMTSFRMSLIQTACGS